MLYQCRKAPVPADIHLRHRLRGHRLEQSILLSQRGLQRPRLRRRTSTVADAPRL